MRFEDGREYESMWCLIGNVVDERPFGPGGKEKKKGTRHFSPGTKLYCHPPKWGDGYEQIYVTGRHRGSRQLVTMIIRADWVTNWRAKVVYSSAVLREFEKLWAFPPWTEEQATEYVSVMRHREAERESAV
ncbi:MAG: hypothetical protein ACE5G0_00320 [Rhodothermales bacterium]